MSLIRLAVRLAGTPPRSRGAIRPSFAVFITPSPKKGRREDRVPAGTRGPLRELHTQEEPHSSIQVWPSTRPSLRDGRTAYAVLSREPILLLASLAEVEITVGRTGWHDLRIHEGLTVASTVRTTRFCRTRGSLSPACRRDDVVHVAATPIRETNLSAPFVRARPRAHRGLPSLPAPLSPDAAASTASPARDRDDCTPPLKNEPGWRNTYAISEFR